MFPHEPAIGVVVATLHRPDDLPRLLDSLLRSTYASFEVYVADQSGDGHARAALGRFAHEARVHELRPARRGLSVALNAGIGQAATELIAITGDDCTVDVDWLEQVARAFRTDTRIAVVFGSVRASACDPRVGFVPGCLIESEVVADGVRDVHRLSGTTACMAVRRSVWRELGGFDESLGVGASLRSGEDLDFALRALRAGYHVLQTPDLSVEHRTPVRWEDRSQTIRRNWFGSGAAFGKNLKLTGMPMASALARLGRRWVSGGSGVAATYGVHPDRTAMLIGFLAGFLTGLLKPVDHRRQLFKDGTR